MGYRYEFASEADGEEISRLLEETEFKGEIAIAYCRRPNAVLSLAKEGDKSAFVVARDDDGKIVGVGACVIKGDVAYLTGLRAVKLGNIPKCYQMLREFCQQNQVRLTYTTILADNVKVQAMLEKRRPSMPNYLRHSECTVNIIRKRLRIKDKNSLIKVGDFYLLKNPRGEEIARGKAVEQWDFKQYVVKHYGWKLRLAKRFLKWIPNVDEVLKFFTLREVGAKDEAALESFLRHTSRLPLAGSFFLYGGASCPVKSIKYKSIVYIVDWDKKIEGDASALPLYVEIADL
jgi:hypothetical protein